MRTQPLVPTLARVCRAGHCPLRIEPFRPPEYPWGRIQKTGHPSRVINPGNAGGQSNLMHASHYCGRVNTGQKGPSAAQYPHWESVGFR
jgi:hypothetical protein